MMFLGHGKNEEDNSLEQVIQLVDQWMADESGYDEETYPQIEAALTQNQRLFLSRHNPPRTRVLG